MKIENNTLYFVTLYYKSDKHFSTVIRRGEDIKEIFNNICKGGDRVAIINFWSEKEIPIFPIIDSK